jgi:hypothetical protein
VGNDSANSSSMGNMSFIYPAFLVHRFSVKFTVILLSSF